MGACPESEHTRAPTHAQISAGGLIPAGDAGSRAGPGDASGTRTPAVHSGLATRDAARLDHDKSQHRTVRFHPYEEEEL
ncbi:protein of unknown function [Streptantibioticus cattleyicolor NRRL 8057 = DSM 46488]|nr:protein of unknown function [Streptantibioticus cattleyicolor NRRL 8057 = DSM 46488]